MTDDKTFKLAITIAVFTLSIGGLLCTFSSCADRARMDAIEKRLDQLYDKKPPT